MPIKNRHEVLSVGTVATGSTTSPEVDLSSMDTALIYLSVTEGSGTVNEVTVQTNADPFGTAGTWRDTGLAPLNVNVGIDGSELVFPFPFFLSTVQTYGSPGNICPQRVRFVRSGGSNPIAIHVEGIRQIA